MSIDVITTLVASAGPSSRTAKSSTLVNYFWHDSAGQLVSSVPLVAPGSPYYLIVASGRVVALAILGSTFPMLSRITDPEAAQF